MAKTTKLQKLAREWIAKQQWNWATNGCSFCADAIARRRRAKKTKREENKCAHCLLARALGEQCDDFLENETDAFFRIKDAMRERRVEEVERWYEHSAEVKYAFAKQLAAAGGDEFE